MSANLISPLGVSGSAALKLYDGRATKTGNVLSGPLNMTDCLAALAHGLGGNSRAQVLNALKLQQGPDAFVRARDSLAALGRSGGPTKLSMATRMWLQQDLPVTPGFIDKLTGNYDAAFAKFLQGGDALRAEVNNWIADNTEQKIKDLLPPGSVDQLTDFILATAMYAKVRWQTPFDKSDTRQGRFTTLAGSQVTANLMNQEEVYASIGLGWRDQAQVQAIKIPFSDGRLAFYAMMPKNPEGFERFEADMIRQGKLGDVISALDGQKHIEETHVLLPRFEAADQFDLIPILQALGITDIFDLSLANFSGIHPELSANKLFVSAAFHGAKLRVDEEGAEGAAATAIVATRCMKPSFVANRPFIYAIRDTETGEVLFIGRMADPSSEKGQAVGSSTGITNEANPFEVPADLAEEDFDRGGRSRLRLTDDSPRSGGVRKVRGW